MPAPRSNPFQLSQEPGADDDNTTPTPIRRDRPSLLDQLSIIDTEGWDGTAGTRLLQYLRAEQSPWGVLWRTARRSPWKPLWPRVGRHRATTSTPTSR